ncbi:MAG: TrmH family RNA methyltransferase [Chlamydiia bacterium]|nr:TrmH family RNA methyltransferase [Chlamydiia bacterium]
MKLFTQGKFLSLSYRQQHKIAGEYLRALYEKKSPLDHHYKQMEKWLKLPPLEDVQDRFHLHMKEAAIELKERHFLINRYDTPSDAPYGSVHLYLEDLRSAFNVGNILRTVESFRLGTVIFSENTPSYTHPKVIKTAMGVAHEVPCNQKPLSFCPRPWIALETVEGSPSLFDFSFPETFTLILGNEERGVKEKTLLSSDNIVQIPLVGSKNSLNVANACAIAAAFIKAQLSTR